MTTPRGATMESAASEFRELAKMYKRDLEQTKSELKQEKAAHAKTRAELDRLKPSA